MPDDILIALGCNLEGPAGSQKDQLIGAINALCELQHFDLLDVSALYETPPWPAHQIGKVPNYLNAALIANSDIAPDILLQHMLHIETTLGRVRAGAFQARTIDLDLLAFGARILPSEMGWEMATRKQAFEEGAGLVLPHPRMHVRGFVLRPLLDIAPDFQHPLLRRSVKSLFADLPQSEIRLVSEISPKGWHAAR